MGMKMDGTSNTQFVFTYKPVDTKFEQGEVLLNFNGNDYKVMESYRLEIYCCWICEVEV